MDTDNHSIILLDKRVRELNCLSDLGHKIDEKPPLDEFFNWVVGRVPAAMQYPDKCLCAINIGDQVYGDPSVLSMPSKIVGGIRVDGELIGYLHIAYNETLSFLDEESAFIGGLVGRISSYIENTQVQEAYARQAQDLSILNEMGLELTSQFDINKILDTSYRYTSRLMNVNTFFVAFYDDQRQEVQYPISYSDGVATEIATRLTGNSLTDHVIRTREPLLLQDNTPDKMKALGIEGVLYGNLVLSKCWLGVPIYYQGNVFGVISVQSTEQPDLYGEREQNLLVSIANQIAIAVNNARNFQHLQRRATAQGVLVELGQELAGQQSVQNILEITHKYSEKLMDVSTFFVAFLNDQNNEITIPLAYIDGKPFDGDSTSTRGGLTDYILSHKQPVLLNGDILAQMKELGVNMVALGDDDVPVSWLGVPIYRGEQVYGVISVQSVTTPGLYTEEDRDLLAAIASQVALAMETVRNIEELRNLVEFAPEAIVLIDLDTGLLFEPNQNALRLYGLSREELLKTDLADVSPPKQPDGSLSIEKVRAKIAEAVAGKTPVFEWIHRDKKGRDIPCEIRLVKVAIPGRNAVRASVTDISERKKVEATLAKRASELETVTQVSIATTTILDPQELLKRVVNLTKESFELYHAHIYLFDSTREQLELAAGAGQVGDMMVDQGWHIPISMENSLVVRVAQQRESIIVNNVQRDPNFLKNELLPDTRAEMAVPLRVGNQVLGVLDIQSEVAGRFTSEDAKVMNTLASQIAVALQTARQYEETQAAFNRTDALFRGSEMVVQSENSQDALSALVESTPINKFFSANILMFDHAWANTPPEFLKVDAAWVSNHDIKSLETGIPPEAHPLHELYANVGWVYDWENIPFQNLISKHKPTFIFEQDENSNREAQTVLRALNSKSLAIFPLITGDTFIGVFTAQSREIINLSDEDIRQISSLTAQAATVLQSQRLRSQMEERLNELVNLQNMISQEAWRTTLSQESRQNWGYLFDHIELVPLVQLPFQTDSESRLVQAEETLLTTITEPQRVSNSYTTSVKVGNTPIGVVGVHGDQEMDISEDEKNFLQEVAEQVAQALERARLIEQTRKRAVELQSVAQVSSAASTILDPIDLLQSVVDLAKNSFNLYHAHIYLLDDEETCLTLTAGAGDIGQSMVVEGWTILLEEEAIVTEAVRTQEGQIVNDVHQNPNFLPNPLLPDTASEMAIPMIVGSRVLGVFDVQSDVINHFTEDDLRTFTTLATQTAVALQNARLYAEQILTVDRLRELDHLKSSFMANMSHELRTPLNSILGFTQVILEEIDGPLTELMVSDLQLIEKNGQHLLNLINEVLDMAKIESGRVSLSLETLDLGELIDEVLDTTSSQALEKSLDLRLESTSDQKIIITGDLIRLKQVLINLVGNSIKFTEKGSVIVKTSLLGEKVSIQVQDTGIGIPPEKLETIFEAFSQVDTSTTRKAGGTGLGLPISRKLVEMHGGRLWAESKGIPGEGSTLHLELPVQAQVKVESEN